MIIFRYFAREILRTMLIATLILLVIILTNQSVQFLERAATGQLPATALLQLISLQIPLLLGYLLPLGLYLGVLLTLSRMTAESEMTVLHTCGMSRAKVMRMVFVIATFIAILVAWLMAVVVPKAQGATNVIFNRATVKASAQQVIPGQFMSFGKEQQADSIVLYADQVDKHRSLHHVFLAKKQDNQWGLIVAQSAFEKKLQDASTEYLVFDDGFRYVGTPGTNDFQSLKFHEYGARVLLGEVPNVNAVQYYSVSKLWNMESTNKAAAAELQWRMAMPLSVWVFALLAVPLSETRPRLGKFVQLFPAMLIYVGYADLLFLTRSWIRSGIISPGLGTWWVHGAAILLVILLMLYRVGWRRICYAVMPRYQR